MKDSVQVNASDYLQQQHGSGRVMANAVVLALALEDGGRGINIKP